MSVQIKKGSILIYRIFDIAEEANLSRIEELLKTSATRARLNFTRSPRQAVIIRNAPVTLNLGESEMSLYGKSVKVETFAKFWDYGVVSILFQVPIVSGTTWDELISINAQLEVDPFIDETALSRAQELVNIVRPALREPLIWEEFEDYAIFFVEEISGIQDVNELIQSVDTASLLVAENSVELSKQFKQSVLKEFSQYSEQDLTLIDWNSALVVEPSGKKEVPEVIEFAVTHLLEMRYYDSLLDRRLTTLYDSIEESRGKFFSNRFSELSREASVRFIEFSEFIERIDNSFKVVGDFYLAKIFRFSGEKFRIQEWETNISRKINLFSNISQLLQGEVNVNRSLWLEITIVVLILFEIITTFTKIAQ